MAPDPELTAKVMKLRWKKGISLAEAWASVKKPKSVSILLFFPKADIIELDMSIEDAAKLVISAGLVYPTTKKITKKVPITKTKTTKKSNSH